MVYSVLSLNDEEGGGMLESAFSIPHSAWPQIPPFRFVLVSTLQLQPQAKDCQDVLSSAERT